MKSHGMANHVMASVVTVGWLEDSLIKTELRITSPCSPVLGQLIEHDALCIVLTQPVFSFSASSFLSVIFMFSHQVLLTLGISWKRWRHWKHRTNTQRLIPTAYIGSQQCDASPTFIPGPLMSSALLPNASTPLTLLIHLRRYSRHAFRYPCHRDIAADTPPHAPRCLLLDHPVRSRSCFLMDLLVT